MWRVAIPSVAPLATWVVTLDARTGEVVAATDALVHLNGVGSVYDPNPIATPSPVDRTLWELDDSGRLSGTKVRVFDERDLEAYRPDGVFRFPPGDPRFVQTNAYKSLTNMAGTAVFLGFPPFPKPVPALVNLAFGGQEYNNAFYDPVFQVFGFGNGDGVVTANLGVDQDVAAHEMGHHLFQVLVDPDPGERNFDLDAMNEGTADTFAAILHSDPLIGESTLPGQPALRDLGPTTTLDVDSDDPHTVGLVYGSANWDLYEQLGWDVFGRLLVASLPYLPPDPELPTAYRDALRAGDAALYGGAHRAAIDAVFAARHFDAIDSYSDIGTLDAGVPQSGALPNDGAALYYFYEFPNSRQVTFQLTGYGDADLYIGPAATLDPTNPATYIASENYGSYETITVTPSTTPSVNADDTWVVFVVDWPDDGTSSGYTITATEVLPLPTIATAGVPLDGSIAAPGEFDFLTFYGTAGQVVRLEATALASTLDPAIAILDPDVADGGLLGHDDDDGPGLDSLIQGVRLPRTDTFGIAVYSPAADVDPRIGTGAYRLVLTTCTATSPDTDGDGLADACDDDDDEDGFDDPEDDLPLDHLRCADYDDDLCDDCSGGTWNFFSDGTDVDGDGYCDLGDEDDDNDGCTDADDASPLSASLDDDLDFRGDDCDDCPTVANPDQADCNGNGVGDACDPTPCPEPGAALGALAAAGALLRRRRATVTSLEA